MKVWDEPFKHFALREAGVAPEVWQALMDGLAMRRILHDHDDENMRRQNEELSKLCRRHRRLVLLARETARGPVDHPLVCRSDDRHEQTGSERDLRWVAVAAAFLLTAGVAFIAGVLVGA